MCDGRPSMLVSQRGQVIADELTNSHSRMAEKYLGNSRMEDECFQPELILRSRVIMVNSHVNLNLERRKEINERIAKSILEYFNKNFRTVEQLRRAIVKTKKQQAKLFSRDWYIVWSYFPEVLRPEVVREKLWNLGGFDKLEKAIELSKVKKNLLEIWRKPVSYKLSSIVNKDNGEPLFA